MTTRELFRLVIAALATIGCVLAVVPRPYWGVALIAVQAVALVGRTVILLNQRRRP